MEAPSSAPLIAEQTILYPRVRDAWSDKGTPVEQGSRGRRLGERVRRVVFALTSLLAVAAAWLGGRWLYGYDDPADAIGALMLVLLVVVTLQGGRRRISSS